MVLSLEVIVAILTSEAVEALLLECLLKEDEPLTEGIGVEGVIRSFYFHRQRIHAKREEVMQLLAELPDAFRRTVGGGASFLIACEDRHGRRWTGMHMSMEELFALGIAIGRVRYLLAREAWSSLPGCMPFLVVDL